MTMKCKKCSAKLEVHRMCRRVRMRCTGCRQEYQIHEVAGELDRETGGDPGEVYRHHLRLTTTPLAPASQTGPLQKARVPS